MKQFKVFRKDKYIVEYRLIIDNGIIDSASKETLQKLCETWLNKLQLEGKVKVLDSKSIVLSATKHFTNVYRRKDNHIIDLYKVEPQYDIREV